MKDILDREILVGDTVAYSEGPVGSLGMAKVVAAASFGMQLQHKDAEEPWIVTTDNNDHYVIVAFGYGVV